MILVKLNGNTKTARPRRRHTGLKILTVTLCVLALAAAWYMFWEEPPDISQGGGAAPGVSTAAPGAGTDISEGSESGRTDGCYTFLIVGRDKSGANTDTILVGKLDTGEHSLNVVSIPRDTMVNTPYNVKKVNTLYAYSLNKGGNGVDGLLSGVKDLAGFTPDCYAVVDLTAFEKLVDTIGGVYYNVPFDMDYDDPDQDLHIHFKAGEQLLDGENALRVVRFRKGNPGSGYSGDGGDISRIGRQQDFLKAVAKQTLTAGNIANLKELISIFTEYVDTDLTAANLSFFAREFLLCGQDRVNFYTMPGNYGDSVGGFSYVSVYLDEWLAMVNDCINPYDEPITQEDVNILTRKDGLLWATTGVIAGGEDSFLTMEEYLASIGAGGGGSSAPADSGESGGAPATEQPPTEQTAPEDGDASGESAPVAGEGQDVQSTPAPQDLPAMPQA